MRRLTALTAGIVLVLTTVAAAGSTAAAGEAPASPIGVAHDNATEYICNMWVTPAYVVQVYVGQSASFTVHQWICSRATHQFLRDESSATYWQSSNSAVASVGSNRTRVAVATARGVGLADIVAVAPGAGVDHTDVRAGGTLIVNPPPFSVSVGGPRVVMANYGAPCTWSAQTTSGTAPFGYAWYRSGSLVSTQPYYSLGYIYSGFSLEVRVTDATGQTVSGSTYVSTSPYWSDHC